MTTSTTLTRYRINGVVDTGKSVMSNLENIANSAGAWITYDITEGKWAVVINKAESSAHSFDDSNIVGPIKLSGSGLDELYNSVEVQFPMRDIKDENDYVRIEIPAVDRKPNEPDHTLTLTYPLVTNPVQATLLGFLELKQSRMDYIIEFSTDYSKNDVLAGDVIDVTSSTYGFTNKLFRVLQITENDSANGLEYKIVALEYADSVYDTGTLEYYARSNADGVITIGDIGQMSQPTITKTETDRKPSILVESTIPDNTDPLNQAGIIEGVEVWYYAIPAAELPTWQTVDDESRIYELHSTVKPFGEVYAPGDDFAHSISDFNQDNFLIKLRAVNAVTQGPFSDHSGLVDYQPKQTTDNITNNTEVDAGSGNILTTLGASALISFLNSLMRDGDSSAGSLFEKIFDVFNTDKGYDLRTGGIEKIGLNSSGTPAIILASGLQQNIVVVPNTSPVLSYTTPIFTPDTNCTVKVNYICDQNTSGANGASTDVIAFAAEVFNQTTGSTVGLGVGSGGGGAYGWTDFVAVDQVSLVAGNNYVIKFFAHNQTTTNPSVNANFDFSWDVVII